MVGTKLGFPAQAKHVFNHENISPDISLFSFPRIGVATQGVMYAKNSL